MAETMVFEWKQPEGTANPIAVPMHGGLLMLDKKRAANETQFIDFRIDGRGYWAKYPNDHIYILLDATVDKWNGVNGYTGRGVILNKDAMTFERFGDSTTYKRTPVNMLDVYRFVVHASQDHVAWFLFAADGVTRLAYDFMYMPDETPDALVSQIVVGATSDFNLTAKVPAIVDLVGIRIGRFTNS